MTEGALKTGRGLKSNCMLLIEKGTCMVVENDFLHLVGQIEHSPESIADVFLGLGNMSSNMS